MVYVLTCMDKEKPRDQNSSVYPLFSSLKYPNTFHSINIAKAERVQYMHAELIWVSKSLKAT